jgi:hypothetical protein
MERYINGMVHSRNEGNDPLLLAFSVNESGKLKKIITHKLLFMPEEMLQHQPELSEAKDDLQDGLRLEFGDQKFMEALSFYQVK